METSLRTATANDILNALADGERQAGRDAAAAAYRGRMERRVLVATGGNPGSLSDSSPLRRVVEAAPVVPRRPGPPVEWANQPSGYVWVNDDGREMYRADGNLPR